MRLPHYMPALEIVRHTDLALTVPALLTQSPGLVAHELPGVFPQLDSELYWRRENSEDAALSWLRALILDAAAGLDAAGGQDLHLGEHACSRRLSLGE